MRNLYDRGPCRALTYPAECLAGCRGSIHVMGILLLILALIGAGYLYISYKEKRVSSDMPKILAAYEGMLDDYIKDPEDRAKLKQAVGIIAEGHYSTPAINELEKMYGCTRRGTLSNKILKELVSELSSMGMKLFKAECLNGTHSVVIACAGSREEADLYFSEYGKVLKCSQLVMSAISK
ncbi:MAG: hypothetical protein ACLQF0_10185 [Dissulfurispiraceae bacterium]